MYKRDVWLEACTTRVIQDRSIAQARVNLRAQMEIGTGLTHSYWANKPDKSMGWGAWQKFRNVKICIRSLLWKSSIIKHTGWRASEVSLFFLGKSWEWQRVEGSRKQCGGAQLFICDTGFPQRENTTCCSCLMGNSHLASGKYCDIHCIESETRNYLSWGDLWSQ